MYCVARNPSYVEEQGIKRDIDDCRHAEMCAVDLWQHGHIEFVLKTMHLSIIYAFDAHRQAQIMADIMQGRMSIVERRFPQF